ncbi:antirestriction protein [Gibbsiella quercinecans]|uniref:antirestriction protein n=1 Tax=Gibbsiella quercinecans TaxID=929813 RepID=UPI000EF21BE4|nr:antirestriction protein [Gibbsiella quercinecans]RLM11785.1 antirestriction protein [Gibbsiella quercinecans]
MQHAHSVALQVCESDRLSFLPYLFASDYLLAEMQVYATAERYLREYNGGFWYFIWLPDGGGYMAPDLDRVHLANVNNGGDNTLSGDAAGIVLTSWVINSRCWFHHDRGNAGMVELYMHREEQLWAHIKTHPECSDICRLLD